MCGIAGMFALGADSPGLPRDAERRLEEMASSLTHRGPDDSGLWVHPEGMVGFGHRRLSIVDLSSRGRQPMSYAGGRWTIAFNGEVYNFRDLKSELVSLGCEFKSTTDTEVVMAAVHRWGLREALRRFRGMYAFALWDGKNHELHLVRDRLGEKPLFLASNNGVLYFASELRALLRVGELRAGLDREALWSLLKLGYVFEPHSMVQGIRKLPAAHFLTIRGGDPRPLELGGGAATGSGGSGGIAPEHYWSLRGSDGRPDPDGTLETRLERLEELIRDTVRAQMQCDVPYGVFLSGGVDSTIVAATMQAESSRPVHTFTVRFDDPDFDEGDLANAIAGHLGTDHHELRLDQDEIVRSVPALSGRLDEPTANASIFAAQLMSKLAREHVKVCLGGDGGDEGFAGYNRYLLTQGHWRTLHGLPGVLKTVGAGLVSLPPRGLWHWLDDRRRSGSSHPVQNRWAQQVGKLKRILLADDVVEAYAGVVSVWQQPDEILRNGAAMDLLWPACDAGGALRALVGWDILHYMPGDNLAKLDRASMAVSLEMRQPLLDHRIVEFGYSLPDEMKIRDGETKWFLKQLLYKLVPRELVSRPKMGFTAPIDAWLRGPLKEWSMDLLFESALTRDGYFRPGAVQGAVDDFHAGRRRTASEIWSLAMLHAWHATLLKNRA